MSAPPAISVVVPVYRHWALIPGLLDALALQNPPAGFEILLVDNAPDEARPHLALPENARILPCAAPGAYAARNAGAAAAQGALLAFTDADCRPDPGWLAALAAAHDPGALLAGPIDVAAGAAPTRYEIYDRLRGIPQARYVAHGYAATANLAVPAPAFRALGGFEAARFSGGDAEFCRRAGRAGHGLRFVPEARVRHPARAAWDELATKARRVKGGQVAAGPAGRRLRWTLRTLTPPLRAAARFARADAPRGERLAATRVLFALWGVELLEMLRLAAGGAPERR